MNTDTDRITIVEHQYSYDLVTDDGTVLAAGIATRQDAEDRRRELSDVRPTHQHSEHPEWHSGGPGKSAFDDYRWQCACGHRYDESLSDGIHPRHAAHLADHTERG